MTVVSRAATLPFRQRDKSVDEMATQLGATLLIDGALQRSGETLRVNVSLLRPGSNTVVWSRRYDGTYGSVFALQREVADATAEALTVTLSPDARQRLERSPTSNLDAFAEYAQARAFLERPDVAGNLGNSVALFQSAITKDPHFARAHAGLGEAYWRSYLATRESALPTKARDAIAEALRLDPNDGRVRYTLALIYRGIGKDAEAEEELARTIAIQPTNDEAHDLLGQVVAARGHVPEGVDHLRTAIRLRPNYWHHHQALGYVLMQAGRYSDAISALTRVTELQPDSAWGYQMLGTAYQLSGDRALARISYEKALQLAPDARAYSNLGTLAFEDGRYSEALKAYEEAARLEPNDPLKHRNLGDVFRRVGQSARARQEYRRAIFLTEDRLRTNADDPETRAMLAVYQAKMGLHRDAEREITKALSTRRPSANVLYRKAVVDALAGRIDGALAGLGQALSAGYSVAVAERDEDLAPLRARPQYVALLATRHTGGAQ
jgi:tetratricopeptide (TPR) repeat protein